MYQREVRPAERTRYPRHGQTGGLRNECLTADHQVVAAIDGGRPLVQVEIQIVEYLEATQRDTVSGGVPAGVAQRVRDAVGVVGCIALDERDLERVVVDRT